MSDRIIIADVRRDVQHMRTSPSWADYCPTPVDIDALIDAAEAAQHVFYLANREGRLLAGGRGLQDALKRFDFEATA